MKRKIDIYVKRGEKWVYFEQTDIYETTAAASVAYGAKYPDSFRALYA